MADSFDIITIGDSTIDTFIRIYDATVECDINHEQCKICIPYGSKIPVDSIAHGIAGNAANVAVGCARLGLATAIYTNLGEDDEGNKIYKALISEKIASDFIVVNKGKGSNLSVVLTFQGERTIFVFHQPWFYHLPDFGQGSWIYLTSMSQSFTNSNIMDEICHYINKSRAKLVYSPGTHQLNVDIKRYPRVLEKCHLLIVNMEEAKRILSIDQTQVVRPIDVLSSLLLLGPANVVITGGEEGSWASDGQRNLKVGILPVPIVEKTGAGDAYSSALVAALAKGKDLAEAMVWGTINASSVIQSIGPEKGLLGLDELVKQSTEGIIAASNF